MFTLGLLYQDQMILQRNQEIRILGTTTPANLITGVLEDVTSTATADASGSFVLTFPKRESGRHLTLTISDDTQEVTLHDISIGDIYIAGGQSNMEFFLQYEAHWADAKADAACNPASQNIHLFNVPQICFEGHTSRQNDAYGHWFTPDVTDDLACFSAPGYYFAKEINAKEDVPVGIIGCNWGGSTATAWLPASELEDCDLSCYLQEYADACALYSEEEMKRISLEAWVWEDSKENGEAFAPLLYGRDRNWQLDYIKRCAHNPVIPMGPYNINRPGGLYSTMLERIIGFPCLGVLWYQGESDSGLGHAKFYDQLLKKLIAHWRKVWNYDLYFFIVQLAPFGVWLECSDEDYATVRQRQRQVADEDDRVGMASILDLGSYYDIHPKEKKEVGRRLSLLARKMIYGEDLLCEGPRLTAIEHTGRTELTLHYDGGTVLTQDSCINDIRVQLDGQQGLVESYQLSAMDLILTVPALALAPTGTAITVDVGTADYGELHIHNEAGLAMQPGAMTIRI
ncbi:MAG: sialate O-acetylesterase [Lachnospiraceae bacterium]|nr:sialate O-acetylesterase [Lachnospiraceae bacterium]